MNQESLFGELRSILQRPASQETWAALCQLLQGALWPDEALEAVAVPYALDIVSRWPESIERAAPDAWARQLMSGQGGAQLALANKLHLWRGPTPTLDELALLLGSPAIGGLRRLNLSASVASHGADALALLDTPHLAGLERLELDTASVDGAGAAALAAVRLPALRWLNLAHNALDDDALALLLRAPLCAELRALELSGNPLTARAAQLLAHWRKGMGRIEHLTLAGVPLGDEGVAALSNSWHVGALRTLDLSSCEVSDVGARTLAASPHMRGLTSLRLLFNQLSGAAINALVATPLLAHLTALDLSGNLRIGDLGALRLAESPHMSNLTSLRMAVCGVGDAGVTALAASAHLSSLTTLTLSSNAIGDAGLEALAASPHLARLEVLQLGRNRFGDAGVIALAESAHLARLIELELEYNPLGVDAARALANAAQLSTLRTLNLHRCHLAGEAAAWLAASPYLHESIRTRGRS
jgi:Ran GTPase-activating protein (RanGAP) involved in mRNA processing and transport